VDRVRAPVAVAQQPVRPQFVGIEAAPALAALVPRPRTPLLAYHGLLAPRARWRSTIVPEPGAPDAAR